MVIIFLIAFLGAGSQQPAQTARLYGRVVASDSGAPVRSAGVRASGMKPTGSFIATTDDLGRFDLRDLPPGQYLLQISKPSFATTFFGLTPRTSQPFELKAGQAVDLGDLRLPRAGVIVGRVHDAFNDPIAEISVTAWQIEYLNEPFQRRVRSVKSVQTNDLGEFRLYGLRPGKYFVSASRRTIQVSAGPGGSSGVTTLDTGLKEAPTFFPGTASAAEAIPVEVKIGEDTLGTNIPLLTVSYGRVTGTVTDSQGRPYDAGVWLVPARTDALVSTVQLTSPTDPQGRFTIVDVSPGDYRVEVFSRAWLEKLGQTGRVGVAPDGEVGSSPITVAGGRLEEVSIQTSPGARWRGRVLIDGSPVTAGTAVGIRVNAYAFSSGGPSGLTAPSSAQPSPDGSFVLEGVHGNRIIRVGLASGTYLHQVIHRGQDVTDRGIEIGRSDTDGIEVHLTTRPTRFDGEVRDAAGSAVANARVVVFSTDRADWMRPMTRRFSATMSNSQGKFGGAGMPPGSYLAAVIPEDDRDRFADPDYIESLRASATPFTLNDGATTSVELRLKR